MTTFRSSFTRLVLVLGAVALAACEKNAVQDITGTLPGSRVKFFNFGLNAPQVHFYANDAKVTATLSATGAESTVGVAYGAAGLAGLYSALTPGQYTFTGRISATVDKDLPIATMPATLADGKAYSVYISGVYNTTTKSAEGFVIEDDYNPTIDFSVGTVRFVNAMANANPMTLYAKNTVTGTEVAIGGAVAYKGAGTFATVEPGIYDISTRFVGASTNAITRAAVAFAAGRTYTITARGDITITSTTATNRPFLDNTTNR